MTTRTGTADEKCPNGRAMFKLCVPLLITSLVMVAYVRSWTSIQVVAQERPIFKSQQDHPHTTDFDTTIWPPMKRVLCSEGAPNPQLFSLLFRLARTEVFEKGVGEPSGPGQRPFRPTLQPPLKNETAFGDHNNMGENRYDLVKNFFSGTFWPKTKFFTGRDENGKKFRTMYIVIYKCANNQIRHMENIVARRLGLVRRKLDFIKVIAKHSPPLCMYTAVRDPISHFLSGYNEVEYRIATGSNGGAPIKLAPYHFRVPWHESNSSHGLRRKPRYDKSKSSPEVRRKRFQALVEDLLLEEPLLLEDPSFNQVYHHFFPMSRVVSALATHGVALTGYIPTLANITSTWPAFMSSTCPGYPTKETIENIFKNESNVKLLNGGHESALDKMGFYEAAKEVWREGGPIARALCLLHAFDYACFEDLPEGIPELCRVVYGEYSDKIA